jgi:hypothetical protein
MVTDIPAATASVTTVTRNLGDFSGWTSGTASQVVALQWQFNSISSSACAVDFTVFSVRFLP